MLEIEGSYGTLRLDIHINDLKKVIKSNKKWRYISRVSWLAGKTETPPPDPTSCDK
jgi:hypothetical protein